MWKYAVNNFGYEVLKELFMFNELLLPGTISVKDTLGIYFEGIKEFFDEMLYFIAKFELKI